MWVSLNAFGAFLPALSLFPGDTPAQEAKCLDEGNWLISVPISAIIQAELWSFIPGIDNRVIEI